MSAIGDKPGAIADYTQVIRLDRNFAAAYNNRGLALSDLGDQKGAIDDFNQALQINPGRANTALQGKHLLPQEHIVDTAYVDAQHLLTSETQLGIELLGPVPPDFSWQQKAKLGFELSCFKVDWEHRHATCPQGHISKSWHQRLDNYGNPTIQDYTNKEDI